MQSAVASLVAASLLLLTASAVPAGGQGMGVPSAHFGALAYPTPDRIWEAGVNLDRFTEFTKPADSAAAVRDGLRDNKTRHYALRTTLGINSAYVMRTYHWREMSSIIRLGAFTGTVGDNPSRFLQNNFRHRDAGYQFIPVGHVTKAGLIGAFGGIDRWGDVAPTWWGHEFSLGSYYGVDGMTSNLYDEVALRFGTRLHLSRSVMWPTVGASYRWGVYVRQQKNLNEAPRDTGAKSMRDVIANTYGLKMLSLRLPLDEWASNRGLVPAVEVGYSWHSAFFLARPFGQTTFQRLPEKFLTLSAQWGGGDFSIETYNDLVNDKDIGPSFGVRTYLRWRRWWWDR